METIKHRNFSLLTPGHKAVHPIHGEITVLPRRSSGEKSTAVIPHGSKEFAEEIKRISKDFTTMGPTELTRLYRCSYNPMIVFLKKECGYMAKTLAKCPGLDAKKLIAALTPDKTLRETMAELGVDAGLIKKAYNVVSDAGKLAGTDYKKGMQRKTPRRDVTDKEITDVMAKHIGMINVIRTKYWSSTVEGIIDSHLQNAVYNALATFKGDHDSGANELTYLTKVLETEMMNMHDKYSRSAVVASPLTPSDARSLVSSIDAVYPDGNPYLEIPDNSDVALAAANSYDFKAYRSKLKPFWLPLFDAYCAGTVNHRQAQKLFSAIRNGTAVRKGTVPDAATAKTARVAHPLRIGKCKEPRDRYDFSQITVGVDKTVTYSGAVYTLNGCGSYFKFFKEILSKLPFLTEVNIATKAYDIQLYRRLFRKATGHHIDVIPMSPESADVRSFKLRVLPKGFYPAKRKYGVTLRNVDMLLESPVWPSAQELSSLLKVKTQQEVANSLRVPVKVLTDKCKELGAVTQYYPESAPAAANIAKKKYALERRVIKSDKFPGATKLKKLVWSMSTVKVAAKFGVSDKAVEKWCKRVGISKPPRGYWNKAYAGKI